MEKKLKTKIEVKAFELWEADGRPEGVEVSNWLRAEAEVLEEISLNKKPKRAKKAAVKKTAAKKAPVKKAGAKKTATRKASPAKK